MKIYLAADHRGFTLKEQLKQYLIQRQYEIVDCGALALDPDDDEVDYGSAAVKQLQPEDRAVLFCGSGHGMDITANRFRHVRAILGFNQAVIEMGRAHEDANVLVIPAEWTSFEQAQTLVDTFLSTPFSNQERYLRRIKKYTHLC